MATVPILGEDFFYCDDPHEYKTASGLVRPSITQLMKLAGIYNFSMVPPAILENARRRGKNVHEWCAQWDINGFVDETFIADDEMPYFRAWQKFVKDFKPVIRKVEVPMLRPIAGVLVGGTPDVVGFLGARAFLFERKACAAKHPGWGIQTAMQEMLETGKDRLGHMGRMAVQLKPNGLYAIDSHEDPTDGDVALAIVQKQGAEDAISNWLHNHNLKAA